nr:hypothetical protein BaRGS_012818 [Batillaria attramentaria]
MDYQKVLQTSGSPDTGSSSQHAHGWQDNVETLTPSPVIQHPQATITPPMARRRFQTYNRDSWDGGGGVVSGAGGGQGQQYQPSKYGLVVEEMYGRENYEYSHGAGYSSTGYGGYSESGGGGSVGGGGGVGGRGTQESPVNSPMMMRRIFNRAPVEHRRSLPDNARTQQLLEGYYDGYASGSGSAGGSTSGYGSGGGGGGGGVYDYAGNMRTPSTQKSNEFVEGLSTPKPRSILRNSHSQSQIEHTSSPSLYPPHHEALQRQGNMKKSVGDLRQWQQQHQEELIHQHIETQALYEKQVAPLENLVRQLGLKEEDPTRWEPIRRAADNIIREKNMIIEKLRQRVLELEEDLKMADNKLRHALLTSDDKADLVHQKLKELQYKNASLKTELAETRTKKNAEANHLEEQLGFNMQRVVLQLQAKEKEVEEWGRRFQDMKANHQQLRQKLDSVERYLADLPTAEESSHAKADDLEQKLMQTRKLLSARDLRVKELEEQEALLHERVEELENELDRVRHEDEAAQNVFRLEHELQDTKQEKERLSIDLEKAKKLLETTHRRLRQTETRLQSEMTELRERLGQEEEAVGALRQEVVNKEHQIDKMKRVVKELGNQNQDLMEQNLILREQMTQFEQHATDDGVRLQRRFLAELGLCFSELQSLVQICMQRARGEDPNMSVLLGVKEAVADTEEKGAKGEEKGQTIKQWLCKLAELRQEVDSLRATICNQYAEDMGQNLQCATQ